ncbi:MAG: serine-type D-Ala-D-Ala carboxypeptidase [Gammaproteobacteria bacterium]|jgi:D-alanyl-D-alanine carboxypeptidase (penicillin-binding protein 5/6)|nr:serine-type D-Ala-D-Ala carboxypeptidase [Gammaproteobacteria bacterium]MBK81891.1 serine-type D-Ala-D-Ala carboxypeptidase [Gammaproteobacteria bacterium]|tara:strand:- start:1716 stop:2882 length:1167 start_codon:yes stop_codon:yes gene_type:complete
MAGRIRSSSIVTLIVGLLAVQAHAAAPIIPPPPDVAASSYLLIDADTEKVLVEHNIHEPLPPASLTKLMTSYIAAVELDAGRIKLTDQVPISVKAWRTGGSKMFIREGTRVPLEDLLRGMIIQSGNDASVAVAEHVAGSEDAFANMMNQQAALLGMTNTHYVNATGLPAEEHYSTAWDLALLTKSMINRFPGHYAMYSEPSFEYNDIVQPNRNRLLLRDRTVDGVKTGHTEAAGYCLVASALRGNMRLISVVMGTASDEARMRESQKLLSYGFRYFETQRLYEAGVPLKTAELWYGEADEIELGAAEDVYVTIPRGHYDDLEAELSIPRVIEAPLAAGDEVGELRLRLADETVHKVPLVALAAAPEGGMLSRFGDAVYLFFSNLVSGD